MKDRNTIRVAGAYRHVVERRCDMDLSDDVALTDITPEVFAAHERDRLARVTALADQRLAAGEPVHCQSWELPSGLGAPFEKFSVGGQRCFVVTSDDRITLKPRKSRFA
jgi:hypothetical protein